MEDFIIENNVLIDYKGDGGNVVIPDSVTKIDEYAFSHCDRLTSINIPDSVTVIGYGAFSACSGLTLISIPNSVTKIGSYAFYDCSCLTSINIPNSVTEIDEGVFYGCDELTSVTIPDSVTKIDEYAFSHCDRLTSINIPNSVTEIGDEAFYDCKCLTSITIPGSVTKIGSYAFYGCSCLISINISNSVTEIGGGAFGVTKIKRQPQGNVAYKGFNYDMTCRGFQYKEGETYVCEEAKLCECGFHACLNPLDCFRYYYGKDAIFHEVVLEDRTGETNESDSKVCGRKITIGRRLTLKEMGEIFNELNK